MGKSDTQRETWKPNGNLETKWKDGNIMRKGLNNSFWVGRGEGGIKYKCHFLKLHY